jgi:pimeloyl-ACP methyl ester carboxylesterase
MFITNIDVLQAQAPDSKIVYAFKDSALWIDDYRPSTKANNITVLFVHGGAFVSGDPVNQKPLADGLNRLGYRVLVLKYRLYLKGKDFGCKTSTPEKLKAIRLAVEDIMDGTQYLLSHADSLQIDTAKLFLAGSSAGAEAALHAVYNPFGHEEDAAYHRYFRFRFAGLLSFAGALLDLNTILKTRWVPLFMMHGTKDQLVPYSTAAHRFCKASDPGWMMFFGSRSIYQEANRRKLPATLYTFDGAGHEVANFMFRRFTEMDVFMKTVITKNVKSKHHFIPTIVGANLPKKS